MLSRSEMARPGNRGGVSATGQVVIVLAACKAADVASEHLGSEDARTTNAMPYPSKTAKNVEQDTVFMSCLTSSMSC